MNTEGWVIAQIHITESDSYWSFWYPNKCGLMHARFPLFMHFHAWDFTSFIILEGVSVLRSTIIISRGGAFEIRKKHQRFRNVAECLVQAKLTTHCKNGNVDIYMEHIFFFLMWAFLWNKYLFKNIYVYTCIFTVLTLGPTLKHLWERILSHTVNLPTKFRVVAFRFKIFIIW